MFSFKTRIVFSIGINGVRHRRRVSTASNTASLSSCMSLLYASGRPFIMVKSAIRSPNTRPLLPRISSVISGFFFCGMMLEPVENASSSSMNLNSHEHQRMISSENLERCTIASEIAAAISAQKSRSATPSRLLRLTPEKPSSFAVKSRSSGYVVPAKAPEPSGQTSIRFNASCIRPMSRRNISAYAIK